ncbi:hypothetical protein MNBD_GAMMA16-60 [hydrothermal vent metagenome]|uniref:Uncharacterized protein n=1 Tax=hydrothermal vent metagenome TaxID=652676 RepID=A0A3B0YTF7_9ZZZZ
MQIKDLIPHIEFKGVTKTLESLAAYHMEASRKGNLYNTCPARFYLRSGRIIEGYIVNYKRKTDNDVVAFVVQPLSSEPCAGQSMGVSVIEASSIEGIDFDRFEKVYQLFSSNDLLEGLGEPPSILSLKKEFENLKLIFDENLAADISFKIDFEDFRDNDKGCWALKEMIKNFKQLIDCDEIDDDFKSAFRDGVQVIHVVNAEKKNFTLTNQNLQLSIDTSIGIQGVPTSSHMYQYLYNKGL